MVNCNFCGNELAKGTGKLFIQKDGKMLYFCSSKCEKSMLVHSKKALQKKWTKVYHDAKKSFGSSKKEANVKGKTKKK